MMQINEDEVLFLYNSNDMQDRRALGYAKSLNHKLKEKDLYKEGISETQVKNIANLMNKPPISLIEKKSKLYRENFNDTDLHDEDILKLIKKNPLILKTPIAVFHNHAMFLGSSFELIKMDMNSKSFKKEAK